MAEELHINGTTLLVYALIYGFEGHTCTASQDYVAKFCGTNRRTVQNALDRLENGGLLTRQRMPDQRIMYTAIAPEGCEKNSQGVRNNFAGDAKNLRRGCEKNSHNNIDNNIADIQVDRERSTAPTFDEVLPICKAVGMSEKQARAFHDYHGQFGWRSTHGAKIIDVAAAARNWKRREKQYDKAEPPKQEVRWLD